MRLLLDTHAVLWALTDPRRLGATARQAIENRANALTVSAATAWELATKHRLGRLPAARPLLDAYPQHLARLGAERLPVEDHHALLAGQLEWEHRDPFDRMLGAQAISESMALVTADAAFSELRGIRTLWD